MAQTTVCPNQEQRREEPKQCSVVSRRIFYIKWWHPPRMIGQSLQYKFLCGYFRNQYKSNWVLKVQSKRLQLSTSSQPIERAKSLDILFCPASIEFGLPHSGQHRLLHFPRENALINAGIYWYSLALKKRQLGTSLVVQWLRIRLTMQGTRVQSLVREDPTCCGATKPASHNY